MGNIKELKRDDSLDHVQALKALMHIPFPVGKNLLVDYLAGDYKNPSINKNALDEYHTFGILGKDKNYIRDLLDSLISKGLIKNVESDFNKFIKVLKITSLGEEEIINPKVNSSLEEEEFIISEEDLRKFEEFGNFLGGYNNEQKKAVISDRKNILCIAGAGSGKTTVLTKRIEFLVKYKGIKPTSILAITFTRKAKEEMERRLLDKGIVVHVHTFNSFAERLLQKYSMKVYNKYVRVISYPEKIISISEALSKMNFKIEDAIDLYFSESQKHSKTRDQLQAIFVNDCYTVFDYFKSQNQDLYDFSQEIDGKHKSSAKMIFHILNYISEYMKAHGLRDYADQILDLNEFFRKNSATIPRFEHVLIDEYQDVNSSQIELIDYLNPNNLFAVGDPRQSIFGWRGSDLSYINSFKEKYNQAEIIPLVSNYRSMKNIINFMNFSIESMGLPNLKETNNSEGEIKLIDFDSEDEEFDFIVRKIMDSSSPREEIFVLSRTNRPLVQLSKILNFKNIPHIIKSDDISRPVGLKKGYLTLATIHSIKGLEAKEVFVIGCNESNFPCKASEHPILEMIKINEYNKDEEERRLFYVAISRSKEKLYLTYSGKNHTYFINKKMKELIK